MNYIVFDIETKNIFSEVGSNDPRDLDISVVSVYDKKTNLIKSFTQEEFKEMWPLFERADVIVGYNSEHFDIPLLSKYYNGDLSKKKSIDIMVCIKESFGKRPKLDNVAYGTLGRKKISHGIEATEWWKQGRFDDVKKYCEEDVLITRDIFEYILKNKSIKIKEKETDKIIETQLDISSWLDIKKEAESKTNSLF